MALKSPTERINELETLVALLNDRLDTARKEIEAANAARSDVAKDLVTFRAEYLVFQTQHALLHKDVTDLHKWKDDQKKERDEAARRLWSFGPNISAAIVGGLISLGVTLFVQWLNKPK